MRLHIAALRLTLRVLGTMAPQLGSHLALRLFMTPPRFPTPRRELALQAQSKLELREINSRSIAVRSWGKGPTVLCCHGWGGRGTQFFAFVQPLIEAGYRVVTLDLPAHGDSSGRRTTLLEAASTLAAVARQEGPVHGLIGHSFGAGTALLALDRFGATTEKLVLISCFANIEWSSRKFAEAFSVSPKLIGIMRKLAEQRYGRAYGKPWHWPELSPLETIRSVTTDILLIHDINDHEIPYEHTQQLHQAAPTAQLLITRRLGHRKILMNPKSINPCIEFLDT
jgi:pimeloyl-ACP methyl ester carboxylesterase